MKTLHSGFKIIIALVLALSFSSLCYSQTPLLVISKNGIKIKPEDMSLTKDDKLSVEISNTNKNIKYKISSLKLEIRTEQPQAIKTAAQAKKFHKIDTLSSKQFERNPKIEIDMKDYAAKNITRVIVTVLLAEQEKTGTISKVDWITYGKEYEFYYY